ncbi:hypothetical protein BMD20_12250 [Burkholderia multivorans]|nr:hypothetical protein BMD20_12250 [Burkholderia multivorans]
MTVAASEYFHVGEEPATFERIEELESDFASFDCVAVTQPSDQRAVEACVDCRGERIVAAIEQSEIQAIGNIGTVDRVARKRPAVAAQEILF